MLSQKTDYLKKTCLRWISNEPIKNENEVKTLEPALDKLIDRHLWNLPIPRFSRSFQTSYNDFNDKSLEELKKIQGAIEWKHTPYIQIIDSSILEKQACILMITCLKYDISLKLTLSHISEDSFIDNCYDLIIEEIGSRATNILDLVIDVIRYKDFENFRKINSAESNWLKVTDLENLNLISPDIQKKMDHFLSEYSYPNIKSFLRLQNIEDEESKFGFWFD